MGPTNVKTRPNENQERVKTAKLRHPRIKNASKRLNCVTPVLHGVSVGETLDDLSDGGPLLSDGDVDAVQLLLLLAGVVETLLVDDRVDGDGGLAGLKINKIKLISLFLKNY
jgi:hypothetical protein